MSKIYTITNLKGGVGKTTTALALLSGLKAQGAKVLGIDMDPQANFTYSSGADKESGGCYELLTRQAIAKDIIQATPIGDIISANKALAGADIYINQTGKEYRLQEALEAVKEDYDYIIIDTPPAVGILTINALTAADSLIIPVQAEAYSLQGVQEVAQAAETVKKYCNTRLKIEGVLLTRYNPRNILSRDVASCLAAMAAEIGTKLFKSTIREGIAIKESQINRQSIFAYAPRAKATLDYQAFLDELQKKGDTEL